MLANQNLLVEVMQAGHRHTESVLSLLSKACSKMAIADVEAECEQLRTVLKDVVGGVGSQSVGFRSVGRRIGDMVAVLGAPQVSCRMRTP